MTRSPQRSGWPDAITRIVLKALEGWDKTLQLAVMIIAAGGVTGLVWLIAWMS